MDHILLLLLALMLVHNLYRTGLNTQNLNQALQDNTYIWNIQEQKRDKHINSVTFTGLGQEQWNFMRFVKCVNMLFSLTG